MNPNISRRGLLGMSGLALVDMLSAESLRLPHFPARAKRMIFILLDGGLSQVDSYDY